MKTWKDDPCIGVTGKRPISNQIYAASVMLTFLDAGYTSDSRVHYGRIHRRRRRLGDVRLNLARQRHLVGNDTNTTNDSPLPLTVQASRTDDKTTLTHNGEGKHNDEK